MNINNSKKNKIDVNDLLSMLREKNYFDINDVAYAIFEPSGKLSVLPKGNQKPVVIEDVNKGAIKPSNLTDVLIVDGVISGSGLNRLNKDKQWLFKQLHLSSKKELKNIILATYDQAEKKVIVHYKSEN